MKNAIILSVTILILSGMAFAQLGIPHNLYGSVTINGAPAPDGTGVSVNIDGLQVTNTVTTAGKYGYSPNVFYVEDPNNDRSGKTMHFLVNGVDSGVTAIFQNGASTQLDLAVTIEQPPASNSGSGGGSSSGGGGGGGSLISTQTKTTTNTTNTTITTTTTSTSQQTASGGCTEKWSCSNWTACSNSVQARTCQDDNKCGTAIYKPWESQPCVLQQQAQDQLQAPAFTAFAIADPTVIGGIIVGIVIILAILYLILRSRKKNAVKTSDARPRDIKPSGSAKPTSTKPAKGKK